MDGFYLCIGQGVTGPTEIRGVRGAREYLRLKGQEFNSEFQEYLSGFIDEEEPSEEYRGEAEMDRDQPYGMVVQHMPEFMHEGPNDSAFR